MWFCRHRTCYIIFFIAKSSKNNSKLSKNWILIFFCKNPDICCFGSSCDSRAPRTVHHWVHVANARRMRFAWKRWQTTRSRPDRHDRTKNAENQFGNSSSAFTSIAAQARIQITVRRTLLIRNEQRVPQKLLRRIVFAMWRSDWSVKHIHRSDVADSYRTLLHSIAHQGAAGIHRFLWCSKGKWCSRDPDHCAVS